MEVVRLTLVGLLIALRVLCAGVFIYMGFLGEIGSLCWGLMELHAAGLACWNERTKSVVDRSAACLVLPALYMCMFFVLPVGAGSFAGQVALVFAAGAIWISQSCLGRSFTVGGSTWCKLVDSGPYALLRHPMLALGLVGRLVVVIDRPALSNLYGLGVALIATVIITLLEEEFLMQRPGYKAYSQRVKYRLLPGVF